MMPSDPHPKLDVFELLSSRRPRHGLGMGLVRAGSTCTDGLEGSSGRSDSHFRGGCGQRAARRALRFVRGRAGGYARARGRAREKNRRGCARQTTFLKRGVGFGATLAKTSCTASANLAMLISAIISFLILISTATGFLWRVPPLGYVLFVPQLYPNWFFSVKNQQLRFFMITGFVIFGKKV